MTLLNIPQRIPPNFVQYQPSDPGLFTSNTMAGLGSDPAAILIRPYVSGTIEITILGVITNTSAAGSEVDITITIGSGTPPTFGHVPIGTDVGVVLKPFIGTAGTTHSPFSIKAIATGLTIGTAYWVDLHITRITGAGNIIPRTLNVIVTEL